MLNFSAAGFGCGIGPPSFEGETRYRVAPHSAALNESAKSLIAGDDLQPAHILVLKQAGLPPAAD
jgi:hypothetical protein